MRHFTIAAAVTTLVLGDGVVAGLGDGGVRVAAADTRVGVMLDVGLPDGVNGALVLSPVAPVRIYAGGGYNAVSPGVRAGVTLAPVAWPMMPTATVEAGRYFEGDARPLVQMLSGSEDEGPEALRRFSYDYANALFGLELGGARLRLLIHAGAGVVRTELAGVAGSLNMSATHDDGGATLELRRDPRVTIWGPAARLGLLVYF